VVIVDERHAGYDHRSLLPLVREFDNVVIVRSLEIWAGLAAFPGRLSRSARRGSWRPSATPA
jgi:hypothetical protein